MTWSFKRIRDGSEPLHKDSIYLFFSLLFSHFYPLEFLQKPWAAHWAVGRGCVEFSERYSCNIYPKSEFHCQVFVSIMFVAFIS